MNGKSLFAITILLIGCAQQSEQIAQAPPVTQVSAATRAFDGVYEGTTLLISDNAGGCPQGLPTIKVEVTNGAVPIRWRQQPGTATLLPDGTFSGSVNDAKANGKIVGTRLEAEIGSRACTYRWELHRTS